MKKVSFYNIVKHLKVFIKWLKEYEAIIAILLAVIWLFISYQSLFVAIPQYQEFIEKNNIPDLNWNWNIEFITKEADLEKYIWMNDKYDVFLIWAKDEYKWKWEKYESYWNIIEPKNRAIIEFETVIKNNNLYWFYNLFWSREVSWNMEVLLNDKWDKFEWTFTMSAANSKWIVIWIKK